MKHRRLFLITLLALGLAAGANQAAAESSTKAETAAAKTGPGKISPARIEPAAVELLKAMSARLASARSMTFDVVATYESPSRYGAPLAYKTLSHVTVERPDKLKVLTEADGPPSEFYYDGKTMMSFAVTENLVAMADAPPTLDAALEKLYQVSGTYFPFADYLVSDPWRDISKNLTLAFKIGQSKIVGGVVTDIVAYESEGVFIQLWIGAEDKLPRMARAVYFDDRLRSRHEIELSGWKLNAPTTSETFKSAKAAAAEKIEFTHPKARQAPPVATKTSTPKSK